VSTHETVRATIMRLSEILDLVGLRTYVAKKTNYGRKPGAEPWAYTRAALAEYAPSADAEAVIRLFQEAGCKDEIAAVRWLLKHDDLVP
jgi:hypothetical protein